jgi:Family of unknown function (DUF5754)
MLQFIDLRKSHLPKKKYDVILLDTEKKAPIVISFGASAYSDYLEHQNPKRRELYLKRHSANEDWNDPRTAGFWSRHILWGNTTDLGKNLYETVEKYHLL